MAADTFSSELGILATAQPRLITAPWRKVAPGTNGGVTATGIYAGLLGSFIVSATATALMPFCPETQSKLIPTDTPSGGWSVRERLVFMLSMSTIGLCGSLLDSLLGALLQASVIDVRTGKVIEGEGGRKVPVHSVGSLHLKQRQKIAEMVGQGGDNTVPEPAGQNLRSRKALADADKNEVTQGQIHHESRKVATGLDILSNNGVNLLMAATMSAVTIIIIAWLWDVPLSTVLGDVLG